MVLQGTQSEVSSPSATSHTRCKPFSPFETPISDADRGNIAKPGDRGFEANQTFPKLSDLIPDNLSAPVSAVNAVLEHHQLSQQQDHSVRQSIRSGSHGDDSSICMTLLSDATSNDGDVVSRGLLDEMRARDLFQRFIAAAHEFLPIFDPIFDTFDSLRRRSTFCFTAILTVAAEAESVGSDSVYIHQLCRHEARRLAAESMFEPSVKIESVQAMIILAAWSDAMWFAVGHALQMAVHLGLSQVLPKLLSNKGVSNIQNSNKRNKILARQVRTWLALYYLEQEIAAGLGRPARVETVREETLRELMQYPTLTAFDVICLSSIDFVCIRGEKITCLFPGRRLQREIEMCTCLSTGLAKIEDVTRKVEQWWTHWDDIYEGTCKVFGLPPADDMVLEFEYDAASFQRTHLLLRKNYAKIILCCTILGKLQRVVESSNASEQIKFDKQIEDIIRSTGSLVIAQLSYICCSDSYKWHFPWAPIPSVVMLAYISMFVLRIVRHMPDLVDKPSVISNVTMVLKLLKNSPYNNYYQLITLLLNILPVGIQSYSDTNRPDEIDATAGEDAPDMKHSNRSFADGDCLAVQKPTIEDEFMERLLVDMARTPETPIWMFELPTEVF
ncbi:hypothetical protein V1525DRAFT_441397 [Lipomyces kononenkoae]|uniref:Uncharacterized protein n=1 Tax=Lipomyces kononenkoae TaxID=34357 RepID=A0ACC3SRN8_LIPKO